MTTPKWFIVSSEDILRLKKVSKTLYKEDYLDGNQQGSLAKTIYDVIKNIEQEPALQKPTTQHEIPEPEKKP